MFFKKYDIIAGCLAPVRKFNSLTAGCCSVGFGKCDQRSRLPLAVTNKKENKRHAFSLFI